MKYKSVRVREATWEAWKRYRDQLQVQVNQQPVRYKDVCEYGDVTLDDSLSYLLKQKDSHTRRGQGFKAGGRPKDDVTAPNHYERGESCDCPGERCMYQ